MAASSETIEVDPVEPKIKLRSYQQEMLEASLTHNVIVAMDTGSGKTPIATFRILAELERTDASKLVWFIAPKKLLSEQQCAVLSEHLPGYLVKSLLGSDQVDKWKDQKLWDATLINVRVVVGTPAVLADALTHGFVKMSRLSLLVFDEAHNCIGNSPMNQIMRDFYHPSKARREAVPHVLGLSASPVISTKSASLQKLEASLDAIAITPKHHRSDLDIYVHPPEVTNLAYAPAPTYAADQVPGHTALQHAIQTYDFSTDPYVLELKERIDDGDGKAVQSLEKVMLKRRTWCFDQLSTVDRKSEAVLEQLGPPAAEWYVSECLRKYNEGEGIEALLLPDVSQKERAHLSSLFRTVTLPNHSGTTITNEENSAFTPKLQVLIDALLRHATSSTTNRAVIFAEQRAVVLALGLLLQKTPELANTYTFGTCIGTSTSEKRKTGVADLVDLKAQSHDLVSFRDNGKLNVLVATSVLEEGIDISACNLVICFDPPKNLVQFVQRRGRARQKGSKYVMLIPEGDSNDDAEKFARQEHEMKEIYRDEQRKAALYTEEEDDQGREYRVDSTGALLHFDNAKAHLYHFCQVSTRASRFVDVRPEFTTECERRDQKDQWTATVTLPSFVHSSLRPAKSTERWSKEETAVKDAAFEAYVALHKGGLVNDNLLPHTQDYGPDPGQTHVDQPSIVSVSEMQNSWRELSRLASAPDVRWYAHDVRLQRQNGTEVVKLTMYLPLPVDTPQPAILYWNESTRYSVEIERSGQDVAIDAANTDMERLQSVTDSLLRLVYHSRMGSGCDKLPFFLSNKELEHASSHQDDAGTKSLKLLRAGQRTADCGLVHVTGETGRAYFLSSIDPSTVEPAEHVAVLTAFPKRRDFLHPLNTSVQNAAYTTKQTVPLDKCTVDALPAKYAVFAAFVPSILHRVDTALLAADLQSSILSAVPIQDQALSIEAISSPSAREASDYNRLEFLGDAVLKFCASLHVMAKRPTWPEGYLSREKTRIVNNNNLAKSAMNRGLDKYIITKPFTGAKWRPPYVDEMLQSQPCTREMSSKVLADVVEALIGAAFVDGGLEKAYACIGTLLPEENWIALPDCIALISAESASNKHIELGLLEQVVGRTFKKPELLIEALTHASFPHTSGGSSYERLEFLGDAVLDLIVVPKLFKHERKPRHWDLHGMRDALVNGDYLAYCCMQHTVDEDRFDIISNQDELDIRQSKRAVHLHDFVRAGAQLTKAKRQCLEQAGPHLTAIKQALENDKQYPWPELIAFKPPKFFSDIIESTLGALFLDGGGDLSVCEAFVEKLGIFEEMRRILDEHVETAYPKEQLGILADKERVDYVCTSRLDGDGIGIFDCSVHIGGEEVAAALGSRSKEEAELRATRKAIEVMEARLEKEEGGRKRKLDVALHYETMVTAVDTSGQDQPVVAGAMRD